MSVWISAHILDLEHWSERYMLLSGGHCSGNQPPDFDWMKSRTRFHWQCWYRGCSEIDSQGKLLQATVHTPGEPAQNQTAKPQTVGSTLRNLLSLAFPQQEPVSLKLKMLSSSVALTFAELAED